MMSLKAGKGTFFYIIGNSITPLSIGCFNNYLSAYSLFLEGVLGLDLFSLFICASSLTFETLLYILRIIFFCAYA